MVSSAGAELLRGLGGYLEQSDSCEELICAAVCAAHYNALWVRFLYGGVKAGRLRKVFKRYKFSAKGMFWARRWVIGDAFYARFMWFLRCDGDAFVRFLRCVVDVACAALVLCGRQVSVQV